MSKNLTLHWYKNKLDTWLPFPDINLDTVGSTGVYVIWGIFKVNGGTITKAIRLGQGVVKDRLASHKQDPDVKKWLGDTRLQNAFVTYADVNAADRSGVESYLAEAYDPLVGERFPNVTHIRVNLPF